MIWLSPVNNSCAMTGSCSDYSAVSHQSQVAICPHRELSNIRLIIIIREYIAVHYADIQSIDGYSTISVQKSRPDYLSHSIHLIHLMSVKCWLYLGQWLWWGQDLELGTTLSLREMFHTPLPSLSSTHSGEENHQTSCIRKLFKTQHSGGDGFESFISFSSCGQLCVWQWRN